MRLRRRVGSRIARQRRLQRRVLARSLRRLFVRAAPEPRQAVASGWRGWSTARRRRFEERRASLLRQGRGADLIPDFEYNHCWMDETGTEGQRCQVCFCLSSWPIARKPCGTSRWRNSSSQQPREWLAPHSVRTASRSSVSLVELWDREGVRLMYRPKIDDGLRRGVAR